MSYPKSSQSSITMKKNLLLILTLAGAAVLNSCSKDDDNSSSTPTATKLQLLTAHGWRLSTFLENGVDMTNAYFSACELDNIYTFYTDSLYSIDEGPTKCNPNDPQIIETGTWAFGNNQNMVILDPGPNESNLDIVQLDANNFKYQESFFDSSAMQQVTYRVYLVKI